MNTICQGERSLYTQVIIWVTTVLNRNHITMLLPRYEGSCIAYSPNGVSNKITFQYPYPTGMRKPMIYSPHYRYLNGVKKDDTIPTLVFFLMPIKYQYLNDITNLVLVK